MKSARSIRGIFPEHDKIMDAMRKHDPEGSQAAMRYHIQRSMEDMLLSFKQP
jgi:DNA-binding GntR family transcriptional regulator